VRGSPLDGASMALRSRRDDSATTHGIDPAQETKLRLGAALFPDRLLDKPREDVK